MSGRYVHAREVVLRVTGITRRFGPLVANERISFELHRGEVLGLLGENGAGKTTLMSILFGHYVADEGRIEVYGEPLPAGSPRAAIAAGVGMVHQHFTLADNLSVLDNVILGSEPMWRLRSDRRGAARRLRELSRRFGLDVDPDAPIGDLAVGERQRVEIPEGALSFGAHPHSGRTNRSAHAPGIGGPVPDPGTDGRAGDCRSSSSATSWTRSSPRAAG